MNDITVKEASREDLDDILRLNHLLFKKEFKEFDPNLDLKWTYSKKGLDYFTKKIKSKDSFVAVAISDKEIVGYICCSLYISPISSIVKAELENMFVLEEFRGKKIGSALANKFFSWSKKQKITNILVTASANNLSGTSFYKKMGFNEFDVVLEKKIK